MNPLLPMEPEAPRIDDRQALARLQPAFVRAMPQAVDLGALGGRVCPVMLEGDRVAIFCLPDYVASDSLDELERVLAHQGFRLHVPTRFRLPAPLLMAVSRGQMTVATLGLRLADRAGHRRSALATIFHEWVAWGVREGASDMHLNVASRLPESEIRYTINGQYVVPERFRRIPTSTLLDVLGVAWMNVRGGNGAIFDPTIEQQGRIRLDVEGRAIMLRWASLATDGGPSVCLRMLHLDVDPAAQSLPGLGYLPTQIDALERARLTEGGAVVLAGVVGSGKSTTLATLMRDIAPTRKVITMEDPVEYLIPNALQNTVGRALDDTDTHAFDAKLKTLKRSAMNDLLIGEVRDRETGRAFMDVAGSGVSVYTTTHTGSAAMIPERLASDFIGVSRDFLATPGVLKLLVYQALLPRLCDHCALPLTALWQGARGVDGMWREGAWWRRWSERFLTLYALDAAPIRVRNPAGCTHCGGTRPDDLRGICGRTVAAEVVEPGDDPLFLMCVRQRDNARLQEHVYGQPHTPFDDENMSGKSAMACAVYKASQGWVDPRTIEMRFRAFESVAHARQRSMVGKHHA